MIHLLNKGLNKILALKHLGKDNKRPVCICVTWNSLNGHLVMFYEATSQIVNHKMIDKWLDDNYFKKFNKNRRDHRADAGNFGNCFGLIKEEAYGQ